MKGRSIRIAILGVVAGGALLAGVAIPLYWKSLREARQRGCQGNLMQLWKLQWINKAQFSGRKPFIRAQGKEFWRALSTISPPLIEPRDDDVYGCPVRAARIRGEIQFLGPARDVNHLAEGDAVGCDEAFNHGPDDREGGNILRKSGDIQSLTGPEWLRFIETRHCVP